MQAKVTGPQCHTGDEPWSALEVALHENSWLAFHEYIPVYTNFNV